MLLILEPLSNILLTISKDISTIPMAQTFHIFTFIDILILVDRLTFTIRLPSEHLPTVIPPITGNTRPYLYLLRKD